MENISKLIGDIFEKHNVPNSISNENYWEAVEMVRKVNAQDANTLIGLAIEWEKTQE